MRSSTKRKGGSNSNNRSGNKTSSWRKSAIENGHNNLGICKVESDGRRKGMKRGNLFR